MKAQALADFIVECSFNEGSLKTKEGGGQTKEVSDNDHSYLWTLHVDGAAGPNQSGMGATLKGLDGLVISNALRFNFLVTNNMTKYKALINGMHLALETGVNDLNVLNDLQLVVN